MSHQRSSGLRNNFGISSILLTAAVVFSDSFPLGVGVTNADPMKRFNHGQAITGHVAVNLFFTMSGYLVTLILNARCFVTGLFLTSNPGVYPDIIFAAIFSFLIVLPVPSQLSDF
jgi:peptidoglycan/LPS O-acetylase OafA/YrhL